MFAYRRLAGVQGVSRLGEAPALVDSRKYDQMTCFDGSHLVDYVLMGKDNSLKDNMIVI